MRAGQTLAATALNSRVSGVRAVAKRIHGRHSLASVNSFPALPDSKRGVAEIPLR